MTGVQTCALPILGVGNFFGMLPDTMQDSRLYGVELDSITGRIAKKLYPQADITVAGFETTDRRDFYDLAVGNVPFGNYKVNDARDKFPKNYRYEFGTELMMSALRCCELIRYANSSLPRRVEYLNEFLVKFDTLKLLLRVCRDRKLINIQTTADIIEMITSIEKQIIGWRNFTASQEKKASVKPEP